jgi:hypothetical protein
MTRRIVGLGLALCTIVAVGCGGSGGGGGGGTTTYSCNFTATSFCYEWTAPAALTSAQVTQLQAACTGGGAGGVFATGPACPTVSRVGTCALANNTGVPGVVYNYRFYSPGFTASSGQTFCTNLRGTWTAG